MESLLEVLKYTLPSLIVLATAYLIIKSFFEEQIQKKELEAKGKRMKELTPLKLQAYERLILFLERIAPHSLLPRTQQVNINATVYQQLLLNNIRTEYEHNLSQQIYVSEEVWTATKVAKENIVKIINNAKELVGEEASSFDLSKAILDKMMRLEDSPIDIATAIIKQEVNTYF